jgi:hypothetical protein
LTRNLNHPANPSHKIFGTFSSSLDKFNTPPDLVFTFETLSMKKFLPFVLAFSLFACNKSDSPSPAASAGPDINTYTIIYPATNRKMTNYFNYDQSHNITSVRSISGDTSGSKPPTDSTILTTIPGFGSTPALGYTRVYYLAGFPQAITELHTLTFDAQHRVLRDTLPFRLYGGNYYSYSYDANGHTFATGWYPYNKAPNGYAPWQLDTFTVASNQLISSRSHLYTYAGDGLNGPNLTEQNSNVLFTRSTVANPLYNAAFANSIGVQFVANEEIDYVSKSLPSQRVVSGFNQNGPIGWTRIFSWVTDDKGRVISGTATDPVSGAVTTRFAFTYR